jgi:hypothetical protein
MGLEKNPAFHPASHLFMIPSRPREMTFLNVGGELHGFAGIFPAGISRAQNPGIMSPNLARNLKNKKQRRI